jgi:alpha-L-fucosidase
MNQITRRRFLAASSAAAVSPAALGPRVVRAASSAYAGPKPTPAQLAWQDFELGIVFHYDLPVFAAGGWKPYKQTFDPDLYQPKKLDTDQWLEAAKAMGCRYAIFTATHFNGFMQWQSDLYPYGLKQTSWRGGKADVMADFVESCRKYDIAPGVYLSCHRNAYHRVWGHRVNWGKGGPGQKEFARIGEKMVEELCSRYGPLAEIWFDAGLLAPEEGGPDVLPIVDKHQGDIVFYHSPQRRDHRWVGNESGVAGDPCWSTVAGLEQSEAAHRGRADNWRERLAHGDADGSLWSPAMVDVPIRDHHWFWRPGQDDTVFTVEQLVDMYYTSVGRNGTFILGGTPDRDGLVPEADFKAYAGLGREVRRRFGKPLAATSGSGPVVELPLPRPARVDHVSLMEDLTQGERVRDYVVEGLVAADRWQELARGESIGHKWIHRFDPVEVGRVRLRVKQSVAPPVVRQLAAFFVG